MPASSALTVAAQATGGGAITSILWLALLAVLFWFLLIRPQRNRQRQLSQVQSSLVPGQLVMTGAGVYGTVTAIEDDVVVLEIAPGVQTRFAKGAVVQVLTPATAGGEEESPASD